MLRRAAATIVRGFCMGAADVVPGVSGGTIALLLGIYARLVASVRAGSSFLGGLARLDRSAAREWFLRVEWGFLLPLLAGILLAIVILARPLETLLEEHPIQLAAAFFGLIAGSLVVVWRLLERRDGPRLAVAAVVAVAVFVALGIREGATEETVSQLEDPATLAFFVSGAVAICAMILPGISGSFLLVLLGMYGAVLAAVNDRELGTLVVFAAGAVLGLALFSQALHRALERHYDTVMAALLGLMAGSTRVLWPWPDGLDSTAIEGPGEFAVEAVLLLAAAAAIVVGLTEGSRRIEHRTRAERAEELRE